MLNNIPHSMAGVLIAYVCNTYIFGVFKTDDSLVSSISLEGIMCSRRSHLRVRAVIMRSRSYLRSRRPVSPAWVLYLTVVCRAGMPW